MLQIWTAHSSYNGPDRLDVSIETGDKAFVPIKEVEWLFQLGMIGMREYQREYVKLMRYSWKNNYDRWVEVLKKKRIVLVCDCLPGKPCHRLILARLLQKARGRYRGEIKLKYK